MDTQSKQYETLSFEWNPSVFFFQLDQLDTIGYIQENVNLESFANVSDVSNYWSVAERLADMAWILQRADAASQSDSPLKKFSDIAKHEGVYSKSGYYSYIIVNTLVKWC